jgi:hypothetical protein
MYPDRKPRNSSSQYWDMDIEVWLMAMEIADSRNITPWDALLLAVRRRAARVQWVDAQVQAVLAKHNMDDTLTPEDKAIAPPEVLEWLEESRREEVLMIRSAKLAIDAGVAEAVVRRLELEGKLVTNALIAGLDSLELTPEQRMNALATMHKQLMSGIDNGNVIEG